MNFLLISILPYLISGLQFPTEELTKSEFLAYERELGSEIQTGTMAMHERLSSELYPFVNNYDLLQPIRGQRPLNEDSIMISFSAYYDSGSEHIKFIEYIIHPHKKDRRKLMREMMSTGNFDENRFVEILNEQENNANYQSGLNERYTNIIQKVSDQKFELKYSDSPQTRITKQHVYQHNGAFVKISLVASDDDWNKHVSLQIYWE